MSYISAVDAQTLDQCAEQMKNIVSGSQLDGLLLDGYLNPETDYSYAAFTQTGANVSMDTYMTESTTLLVKTARRGCAGGKHFAAGGAGGQPGVGHRRRQEGGIDLAYTQTSLGTYHADTRGMIEQGLCDFVVVKNYGATASETPALLSRLPTGGTTPSPRAVSLPDGTCLLPGRGVGKRLGAKL